MKWFAKYWMLKRKHKLKRNVTAVNLEAAENALILYDATEERTENKVHEFVHYLKKHKVATTSLGYYRKKNKKDSRPSDNPPAFYFDKIDLSIIGIPKSSVLKRLMMRDFDLLFDFNKKENFPLQYLSTLSKAKFKLSWAEGYQQEVCDLTITTENRSIGELMEQLKHYLPMINKNT